MPDACVLPMAAALHNQEPSLGHGVWQDSWDLEVLWDLKIKPANQDSKQCWTKKTKQVVQPQGNSSVEVNISRRVCQKEMWSSWKEASLKWMSKAFAAVVQ